MDDIETCPHCKKPGILVSSRRYYSRGWPAVCRECGGLSYDKMGCLSGCLVEIVSPLILLYFLAAPWWIDCAIVFALIAAVAWARGKDREGAAARFRPITPEKSRFSRRVDLMMVVGAVACAILLAWVAASGPRSPSAPRKSKWKLPIPKACIFP